MTGRLALSRPGVQTWSVRQSSPTGRVSIGPHTVASSGRCGADAACGERPAKAVHSRTPVQGSGFLGGTKRLAPAVEAPYGMPLKTCTPSDFTPETLPDS